MAKANPQTYLPGVAMTLNNLGVLQKDKNEHEKAEQSFEEALEIRRSLAKANPQTYLPDVAMTATNMSIFYLQSIPDKARSLSYAEEALRSALPFVALLPVAQQYVRTSQQVIVAWGEDPEAFEQKIGSENPN